MLKGIIHLARTKNFPKKYFLPPDTNNSFSENFAYVLYEWSENLTKNTILKLQCIFNKTNEIFLEKLWLFK